MLQKIIDSLSKNSGLTDQEFWERISSDNIEDFLTEYVLPPEIYFINTDDYTLLKELIIEDVIKVDDKTGSLLGQVEVDIVADILMFTHLYGSFSPESI